MSEERRMIPVWFFAGILLFIYGILIFITGLAEWSHPPATVELSNLHAPVWWGAIMILMGGFFIQKFRPRKNAK